MKPARPAKKGELIVYAYNSQGQEWWGVGLVAKTDREGYATHYKKPGSQALHEFDAKAIKMLVDPKILDMDRLQAELDFNLPYHTLDQARDAVARFRK